MKYSQKYKVIDLFAGAGGLSAGFAATNRFRSVFAVEFDRAAANTYSWNFEHEIIKEDDVKHREWRREGTIFVGDIRNLGKINIDADVIIGGPPCQGFSPLGKISPRDEHLRMNQLWQEYMRIVACVHPVGFVIENVPAILKSKEAKAIKLLAARLGYSISSGELKAVDFGVPQRRVRAFIVGIRGSQEPYLPTADSEKQSVRDAIGDLPLYPETTELGAVPEKGCVQNLHFGRNPTALSLKRYKLIPPGGNRFDLARVAPEITPRCWLEKRTGSTDVFGRLKWDESAYTIRTEFFKPEKGCYLHPEADRPITHREAARLQTFDDKFAFCGSKVEVARQIGNAVPPRLAKAVADCLAKQIDALPKNIKNAERNRVNDAEYDELLQNVMKEIFG